MNGMHRATAVREVLASPTGVELLRRIAAPIADAPDDYPMVHDLPIGGLVDAIGGHDEEVLAAFWADLARIPRAERHEPPPIEPDPAYAADAPPATVQAAPSGAVGATFELRLSGPSHGNPFVDVDVWADFDRGNLRVRVGGFYDGDGQYLIRFLPPSSGKWSWATGSTCAPLRGHAGTVQVEDAGHRGPVRVVDRFHFAYADGTPYVPIGTTLYAWTHQPADREELTLRTLAGSAFTKVRMCALPKSYDFNEEEPERFPFVRSGDGFDTTCFDVEFWRHLEGRVRQLGELGIEADVILLHPYDRWGFADLGRAADDRFVTYAVRRLAGLPNVWWSLANEYDLLHTKDRDDWDRLAAVVQREDPVGHLLSIHNWQELFDYSAAWATHCSIQQVSHTPAEDVTAWRERWGKPVIVDELGYEGDLEHPWGNLSAQELVRRCWEVTVRGGYVSHGETYWNPQHVLWWSKGGTLRGESPARLAFLASVVADSPDGRLDTFRSGMLTYAGGTQGSYELHYLGTAQPRALALRVPRSRRAAVDVLDTWGMTVTPVPGEHEGEVRVELPARPWMAVRLRVLPPATES